VTADDCKKDVFEAAKLLLPRFDEKPGVMEKVSKLEDHALLSARWRGRLEEGRLYMEEVLHRFIVQWEKLEGWEVHLRRRSKEMTKDDIIQAKRNTNPVLWENISDTKHLVAMLSAAIRRLEKDEERGSRVYTFLTGN
jgi:hypothetical protein